MKISTEHIGRILEAQLNKLQRLDDEKPVASPKTDQATFSARAEEIDMAMQIIAGQADTRADKVAQLRKQIAEGNYEVSAEDVAEKILAEARLSKLLEK